MKFKTVEEAVELGFIEISKDKYNSLLEDIQNDPYGKYNESREGWENESAGDKKKREKEYNDRKLLKSKKLQEQKDSEFLETYNRLKDAGLIN